MNSNINKNCDVGLVVEECLKVNFKILLFHLYSAERLLYATACDAVYIWLPTHYLILF